MYIHTYFYIKKDTKTYLVRDSARWHDTQSFLDSLQNFLCAHFRALILRKGIQMHHGQLATPVRRFKCSFEHIHELWRRGREVHDAVHFGRRRGRAAGHHALTQERTCVFVVACHSRLNLVCAHVFAEEVMGTRIEIVGVDCAGVDFGCGNSERTDARKHVPNLNMYLCMIILFMYVYG
jgi:hypothetical protein